MREGLSASRVQTGDVILTEDSAIEREYSRADTKPPAVGAGSGFPDGRTSACAAKTV